MDSGVATVDPVPGQLSIRVAPTRVTLPDAVKSRVEEHWAALKQAGRPYWDGPVYTVVRQTESADALRLELGHTDYAHYLATRHGAVPLPCGCRIAAVGGVLDDRRRPGRVYPKRARDVRRGGDPLDWRRGGGDARRC